MAVGTGYDLHRMAPGKPLWLGGLEIPHSRGAVAHSDGDVLIHALIDALLGAAGRGDIGTWFPDTDDAWKGASGADLLARIMKELSGQWRVVNADMTLLAEEPKMGPYREPIRIRLAGLLGIPETRVNVKAKTMEGLGPIGAGEAIAALAAVELEER